MNDYRYPNGMMMIAQVGREMVISNHRYTITKVLSEKPKRELHEYWVVYEATAVGTTQRFALKVRYQLVAPSLSERDLESEGRMAEDCFNEEHRALRECEGSGHTPRYFGHGELPQGANPHYPAGYARVIAMSLVRGTSVVEIEDLRFRDQVRAAIREKLTETLEYIRLKGWTFFEPETEQIFYDSSTKKICLVGFSRAGKEDYDPKEEEPFTKNSMDVLAFGLGWRVE
ncbi:hypothetical protein BO70DRAFT_405070 [Aspergillus heteromorphus CBS 117.55]|uniref:Protein kinase domain-containing protein n=1 Tax=Aspergillus heteromorphus CBS 117.55 TaxID=1448321 RepID=A0A317WCY7_9EURO|nr:uncharacterized protein BO70DRAFT_405070 [Aspergillus heteromorphus CBS 117.55]PWY82030.1 hypothetical protein BO70DRAFT_405070 [Aspergillus heteromorphus CBS 117.55]